MALKDLPAKKKIFISFAILFFLLAILEADFFLAGTKFLFRGRTEIYKVVPEVVGEKMQANFLKIPSLGIEAPIVYVSEKNEVAYQKALLDGVAHYPDTAEPGQFGNTYIFGHSSDYLWGKGKYKTVFATLPKIHIGDEIAVSDKDGNKFVYKTIESKKVAAGDLSVLDQFGKTRKLLTLQTSYPIGTALARWVVVAELK